MALQFYLGRAGSGKTEACFQEIAERLREDASPRSGQLILLLPEQATAQAESRLLAEKGLGGFSRLRVLSFRRLAHVVLEETGGAGGDFLGDHGRRMLLRLLIERHREKLRLFGDSASEAGFIEKLADNFRELAQCRVAFADLRARYEELQRDDQGESLLARKLHDLALLGEAWDAEIGRRFRNPDHFLDALAERLGKSSLFHDAEVWVDGFASFMPQERQVFAAILKQARTVRMTLLLDPDRLEELPSRAADLPETRLFAQTEQTWLRLRELAASEGIECLPDRLLPEAGAPTRFAPLPVLGQMELRLAECGMLGKRSPDTEAATPQNGLPRRLPPLLCIRAAGRREEAEAVARGIRRLAREEGYRYREIAIIVRDLEPYHALLRDAFERHGIPHFLDRRRDMAHHPLVELLRSALRCVTTNWRAEDVLQVLKTDLAPIGRAGADRIENVALAHAARGREWWTRPSWPPHEPDEKATRRRDRALAPLLELDARLRGGPQAGLSAADFASALADFLDALQAAQRLRKWSEEEANAGHMEAAREHEQVWDAVCALLRETADSLGQEALPLETLAGVFESGLSGLTLGLVPPALDQVLVGSIERSRQPELRAAFVMGLHEQGFPRKLPEDSILNDKERERLTESGLELAPGARQRLFRERMLGYIAFTRAHRHLILSYPATDEKGSPLAPSPFLGILRAVLAEQQPPLVEVEIDADCLQSDPEAIETPSQLAEAAAIAGARGKDSQPVDASWWRDLARRLDIPLGNAIPDPAATQALAPLPEALRELLLPTDKPLSVSRLECQARCPFQHFARYGLRLKPREQFSIQPMDLGSFYHAVLQELFLDLRADERTGLDWGRCDLASLEAALDRGIEKRADEYLPGGGDPKRDFLLARGRRILMQLLEALRLQGIMDHFNQVASEHGFGREDDPAPPLRIDVPGHRELELQGVIDRIDRAFEDGGLQWLRVIDYKSSPQALSLDATYRGLELQLPIYLEALRDRVEQTGNKARPAAALFLPIRQSEEKAETPGPDPERQPPSCRGMVDRQALELFEEVGPGEAFRSLHVSLKKNGEPARKDSGDWLEPEELLAVCRHARAMAGKLAAEIIEGRIAVQPLQLGSNALPCDYCEYADVCRVDPLRPGSIRRVPKTVRKEAIRKMLVD